MTDAELDAPSAALSITEHELASVSGPTNPALTEIVEINGHGHALDHRRWLARGRRHHPGLVQRLT
jgi:hypothetical protein